VSVSIIPQRELENSVAVERLIASGESRAALDYLAARQPVDFAPARTLPPKPYEREFFSELPACFGVVRADDPPWVRLHLMRRLDQMPSHYLLRWSRKKSLESLPVEEQIKQITHGLGRFGPDAGAMLQLLDGLERIPEGREWLKTNQVFLAGVRTATDSNQLRYPRHMKSDAEHESQLLSLSNRLHQFDLSNVIPAGTLTP
jgi:hypothetical protein